MDNKNAQVQRQLQERDAEINRLRRDLRALGELIVRIHIVTAIRQQIYVVSTAAMNLLVS